MRTKYGVGPIGVIWPADVTLIRSRQPDAKSCSATSTANGALMLPIADAVERK